MKTSIRIKSGVVIFIIFAIFMLCSFKNKNAENVNIYVQKRDANAEISANSFDLAEANDKNDSDIENKFSDIYNEFINTLPQGVPYDSEEIVGTVGIGSVIEFIFSYLSESGVFSAFLLLLGMSILFSLAEILCDEVGEATVTAKAAVCICLCLPVFSLMKNALFVVYDGLVSGSEFFSKIIPVISSVAAIGSGATTASVGAATMSVSLSFVSEILTKNLLPLGTMMFSLSMLSSFDTGAVTSGVSDGIRGLFNFLIGITSLIIVATLAVQTVISVSSDTVVLKSAKYAVSGMIPVVGGTVSGALSALVSGIKFLSSTIGVVSVIALLSVMSGPLVLLLFYRFCLWACITLTSFSGAAYAKKFFSSIRSSLDTVIAVLASSILIYILEIVIITKSLQGIA